MELVEMTHKSRNGKSVTRKIEKRLVSTYTSMGWSLKRKPAKKVETSNFKIEDEK